MNHGCLDMTANAPAAAKIAFAVVQHLEKAGVEQVLNVLNVLNTVRPRGCSTPCSEVVLHMFNNSAEGGVEHGVHNTCTTLNRGGWHQARLVHTHRPRASSKSTAGGAKQRTQEPST